jgi:hypothetical protein
MQAAVTACNFGPDEFRRYGVFTRYIHVCMYVCMYVCLELTSNCDSGEELWSDG